ncbi:MAG: succinylglutamate desuccinylase/aspartoacylase family protein [Gammaproteobacteria bacterium]|nr:succinylglutamate desuccinylase/aspartoacylase family protein [Gammaproteobacteria bacterium]
MTLKFSLSILIALSSVNIFAEPLQFSLHKITSEQPGPTMLVIGGIQGDEPGGFTAASMLVTNYKITKGNVWVVPNLNFESIIRRSRGIHGDMNRKFKEISKKDPEFDEVQKIKKIILNKEVDVVLNLHDGSGFYKKTYINRMHNPGRWGQSIIIDQERLDSPQFGDLSGMADNVQQHINRQLKNKAKFFYVKNTETSKGDVEMEKSLTYFSIKNKRPAFAVEASKSFLTHERTYYHLLAVEGFMNELGIEFQRDFEITKENVAKQIGNNLKISLYDNRINLEVEKARRYLNYVPLKKHSSLEYKKNNPLIAVVGNHKSLKVRYGNRYVTSLKPQYFEYDYDLESIKIQIDGIKKDISIGEKINVENDFRVLADSDYRVNIIGFAKKGVDNENDLLIQRKQIKPRFSIDKNERIFRVELYKGNKFSGMILVNFIESDNTQPLSMNASDSKMSSSNL